MPAARQTSASRRSALAPTVRHVGSVPAIGMAPAPRGEARRHQFEALLRALVGVREDPLLAARESRAAAVGGPHRRRGGSPGGPRPLGLAQDGPAWSATRPSHGRVRSRRTGSDAGSTLSTSWSSAAASTSDRSTAVPLATIARGQERRDLGDGARVRHEPGRRISREESRAAAATRPGTVIASMVAESGQ